jgi:CheY-like chemotaxis protein
MAGGGKITIETANAHLDDAYAATQPGVPAGQYVLIAVSDTGPGMTSEVMTKAFDPFFTTKPLGEGTGLGLSQVHGFVKQSGGHIKIYSELGVGTAIKIYLPRSMDAAAAKPRSPDLRVSTLVEPGTSILVVEDDEHVRIVTVASLRDLGYVVLSASRPSEALAILGDPHRIDLLLSDVVMPEMDGRKLADAALKLRPSLRVLFTTGYTKNAIVHNGQLDLGTNLLMKPFSVEQLGAKVASVLRTMT